MAMKYCDKHQVWYDYNDSCPECTKFGRIAGNIIGGSIFAVGWAGKKIYDKIKEQNNKQKTAAQNRIEQEEIKREYKQSNSSDATELDDIVKLNPRDLCIKANTLLYSKRYDEAIAYYEQGIKLYPNESAFWGNKGIALEAIGRCAEAIFYYDQAIKLNPNSGFQAFKDNALQGRRNW